MILLDYLAIGMATVLAGCLYLRRVTGIGFVPGFAALYAFHLLVWPLVWAAWTLIFVLSLLARVRP